MAVSTKCFTVNKTAKTFIAEISTIGDDALFNPFDDDPYFEGLDLQSHVSGNVTLWRVVSREHNDGELVAWHLEPYRSAVEAHPELAGWTMVIFND